MTWRTDSIRYCLLKIEDPMTSPDERLRCWQEVISRSQGCFEIELLRKESLNFAVLEADPLITDTTGAIVE